MTSLYFRSENGPLTLLTCFMSSAMCIIQVGVAARVRDYVWRHRQAAAESARLWHAAAAQCHRVSWHDTRPQVCSKLCKLDARRENWADGEMGWRHGTLHMGHWQRSTEPHHTVHPPGLNLTTSLPSRLPRSHHINSADLDVVLPTV